jgi:hypothetical protein
VQPLKNTIAEQMIEQAFDHVHVSGLCIRVCEELCSNILSVDETGF